MRSIATAAALLSALAVSTACSTTQQSVTIENVDSLVSRVEQVHLETELSKQTVYGALVSLGALFATDFQGDPAEAFAAFAVATEECEKQANELRVHVSPMRRSATTVFQEWEKSLENFSSAGMKERSASRLEATRERFVDVQESATEVQVAFDALNASLRDMVLFLGHDFNSQAVLETTEDAYAIRDSARALGAQFDDCMDAAATYVEKSALRGQAVGGVTAEVTRKSDS